MLRRSVPTAHASVETIPTVSSERDRSRLTPSASSLPSTSTPLERSHNRRNKRRGSTSSSRSSFPYNGYRPAPAVEILRFLLAGCFSVAVSVFVALQLWSAIDWVFSTTTNTSPSSSSAAAAAAATIIKRPWNPIYHAADAHESIGDRSDGYAALRSKIDREFTDNAERSLARVRELQSYNVETFSMQEQYATTTNNNSTTEADAATVVAAAYNVLDCPDIPPAGYPFAWNLLEILDHWPVDDTTPRPTIHQGLCVFDYQTDYDKAMTYRNAELPFVVANDPAVAKTAERWNAPGYMEQLLGDADHRTEYSENNHFMYFVPIGKQHQRRMRAPNKKIPEGWKEPTGTKWMSYKSWLALANVTDDKLGSDMPHWYFRLFGDGLLSDQHDKHSSDFLYDELPFFQPKEGQLYLVEQDGKWGINCRFGMKGVIAANHFDGSRNSIAVLGGSRRYVLAHPAQCDKMALYPMGHPSGRHSAVDWSNPDLEAYPEFAQAKANEVVLQPGHVLYLPTDWFHLIVSLELNMQCNTRSGVGTEYSEVMQQCGFYT